MTMENNQAFRKKTANNWEERVPDCDTTITEYFNFMDLNTDDPKYKCLNCEKAKSPYHSGLVKNMLKHLTDDKHKSHFQNNELNDRLLTAINKIKYVEEPSAAEVSSTNNGIQNQIDEQNPLGILFQFEIAKFLVDKRLPFVITEELVLFIRRITQKLCKEPIPAYKASRDTITRVVNHCICGSLKQKIIDDLKRTPYSLAIDETTDPYGSSYLAICATYLGNSPDGHTKLLTRLISVIQLDVSKTGQAIFDKLDEEFFSKDKSLKHNLMGIATDQGSNMVGRDRGLTALIAQMCPYLVKFNDISHIFNLVFKSALKAYSFDIVGIISKISAHFNASTIRAAKLESIQIQCEPGKKPRKVKAYVPTRWLSLTEALERILMLWKSLEKYYRTEVDEEERRFINAKTEYQLRTALVLFKKLTFYNVKFQQTNIFYNQVMNMVEESYLVFAKLLLKPHAWEETRQDRYQFPKVFALSFDTSQANQVLMTDQEFSASWVESYPDQEDLTSKLSNADKDDIMSQNKAFVVRVLAEMKERLPFSDEVLKKCQVIFSLNTCNINDWRYLMNRFTNIVPQESHRDLQLELDRFELAVGRSTDLNIKDPVKLWVSLEGDFPLMAKLAKSLLTLPHSSVPVERTFSQLKNVKTMKRNRLTVENLEACCLVQQKALQDYEINQDMLDRRASMWLDPVRPAAQPVANNDQQIQPESVSNNQTDSVQAIIQQADHQRNSAEDMDIESLFKEEEVKMIAEESKEANRNTMNAERGQNAGYNNTRSERSRTNGRRTNSEEEESDEELKLDSDEEKLLNAKREKASKNSLKRQAIVDSDEDDTPKKKEKTQRKSRSNSKSKSAKRSNVKQSSKKTKQDKKQKKKQQQKKNKKKNKN